MPQVMPASTLTSAELRQVGTLEDLTEADLDWLRERGQLVVYEAGEHVMEAGQPAEAMFILLAGGIQLQLSIAGQQVYFAPMLAGGIGGVLPYSRMKQYLGTGSAIGETRALRIDKQHFPDMLVAIPLLAERLVAVMSDRVRESTRIQQEREKMMALGKLSAGLAHELNNPATAVRRAASELSGRVEGLGRLARVLAEHRLDAAQVDRLQALQNAQPVAPLSVLERSEREEELTPWLESLGCEEPWVVAETLTSAGFAQSDLEPLLSEFPSSARAELVHWLESIHAARRLARDVATAALRISELVGSIKAYSHMDRGTGKQLVDVRDGLETTLVMLGHKLKRRGIVVSRDFADRLPRIVVFPGELNQVWTNLIDNAIDAMADGGRLELVARPEGACVAVSIIDDGHGIPEEARPRIFEPFFTTKTMGEGTGLGLEVVHRIVTQRHGGDISVESRPGRTSFTVWLPIDSAGR